MQSEGFVIWRDKVDPNFVNFGVKISTGYGCVGQVHIDAFYDWFSQDGDEYKDILELAKDAPLPLVMTLKQVY